MSNNRARFGDYNYHADASVTYSTEDSPYVGINSYNEIRSSVWQTTSAACSIIFDLGSAIEIKLLAMFGPLNEVFTVSTTATVTISGNTTNVFTSPAYQTTVTPSAEGIFCNIPSDTTSTYRYWKIDIVDAANTLGYQRFGYIYIGNVLTFELTNIARGFTRQEVDNTVKQISESGTTYYDIRTPYEEFSGLNLTLANETERLLIKSHFGYHGVFRPFVMCLDPFNVYTTGDDDSRLVTYQLPPTYTHVIHRYYNVGIAVKEVI
jgi:hypothetical protein